MDVFPYFQIVTHIPTKFQKKNCEIPRVACLLFLNSPHKGEIKIDECTKYNFLLSWICLLFIALSSLLNNIIRNTDNTVMLIYTFHRTKKSVCSATLIPCTCYMNIYWGWCKYIYTYKEQTGCSHSGFWFFKILEC